MKAMLMSLWHKWMQISEFIGNIISRIILTVLYFTIFAVLGIIVRTFSDRLQIKTKKTSYWLDAKGKVPRNIEESREQG